MELGFNGRARLLERVVRRPRRVAGQHTIGLFALLAQFSIGIATVVLDVAANVHGWRACKRMTVS